MPTAIQRPLQPRKMPVQARSAASVDAILEATLQVLLQVGKEQLTTTRVAARAGVSVGTLYQYFPNKSALLQATMRRHFEGIATAVLETCERLHGATLEAMAEGLVTGFMAAKMRDGRNSVALYAVSSDVEGVAIAREMQGRTHSMICTMLRSASDGPLANPELVTTVVQGVLGGVSRQILEADDPEQQRAPLTRALTELVRGYLTPAIRS